MKIVLSVVFLLLAGCATAPVANKSSEAGVAATKPVDPVNQEVSILAVSEEGELKDTRCSARNDKGTWEVTAPGKVTVARSAKVLEITCVRAGYRVAMQTSESGGDVVKSAATGAVVGGAVSAVAAMPLLAVPVIGMALYAGAVGGTALLGGTVNAAVDHSQGSVYAYPTQLSVRMIRDRPADVQTELPAAQPPTR